MSDTVRAAVSVSETTDPFAGFHGQPMLGSRGPHYAGRVVLELWDTLSYAGEQPVPVQWDAAGLALLVDPASDTSDGEGLFRRIVAALPLRLANM